MNCFKKNPKIEGDFVWVQGKKIGKGEGATEVVCGEEYKPFANPNTFPGRLPKLINVSVNDLTTKEKDDAAKSIKEQAEKPPRHLGVIKSDQIGKNLKGGGKDGDQMMKISSQKDVTPEVKAKVEDQTQELKGKVKIFGKDIAREEVISIFPGVTAKNVDKFIDQFKTAEEVVAASNVDMKKSGVAATYFRRLREKAEALLEGEE